MPEKQEVEGVYSAYNPEGYTVNDSENDVDLIIKDAGIDLSGYYFIEQPTSTQAPSVTVSYTLDEGAIAPKRGREADVAHDLYTLESAVLLPNRLACTLVKTGVHTAFDAEQFGLFINLRSGVTKYPVMLGNHQGVVEGEYRGDIGLPLRNTYVTTDRTPLSKSVLTIDETGKLTSVPLDTLDDPDFIIALNTGLEAYDEEQTLLGIAPQGRALSDWQQCLSLGYVPTGTLYIPKGTRMAQAFILPRYNTEFTLVEELPNSDRGAQGFGSSGVN